MNDKIVSIGSRRNTAGGESGVKEMTKWGRLKNRIANFFTYRIGRKIPRLVWYGDKIYVRVQLTEYGIGGDFSSAWKAEDALHKNGITFDTGAGVNGRDWEWDCSLKGPIEITFRGKP